MLYMVRFMIVKKSIILAIGQVINKILGIVFVFVLSHNSETFSIYTMAYLVFSLFSDLATLGLIPGTSKVVSKMDSLQKASFLSFGRKLTLAIGVIFILIYIVLMPPIAKLMQNNDYLAISIAGMSLCIMPRYFFNRGYLQGQMKMGISALSLSLEGIVRILILLIALKTAPMYLEYMALMSNFIAVIIGNYVLHFGLKEVPKEKSGKYLIHYFDICLPYGMTTLFFTLYQAVDTFTLRRLLPNGIDLELVSSAYLYQANRLIYLPIMIASSFAACIIPTLKEDKEKTIHNVFLYLNAILIFFFGIYILYAKELFNFVYPNNALGYEVLKQMSILILILGFYKVILGILHSLGRVGGIVCITWIAFVLKFILNYTFVPKYASNGALLATIISSLLCIVTGIIVIKRQKIGILKQFMSSSLIYFLLFSFSALASYFIGTRLSLVFKDIYLLVIEMGVLSFIYVSLIIGRILWKLNQ